MQWFISIPQHRSTNSDMVKLLLMIITYCFLFLLIALQRKANWVLASSILIEYNRVVHENTHHEWLKSYNTNHGFCLTSSLFQVKMDTQNTMKSFLLDWWISLKVFGIWLLLMMHAGFIVELLHKVILSHLLNHFVTD